MVAESKNARRKRMRFLEGKLKGLPALLLLVETLRRSNHGMWSVYSHNRELERTLKSLSEQYLKVCQELHDLHKATDGKVDRPLIIRPNFRV